MDRIQNCFLFFLFKSLASDFPQYSSYIKTGENKHKIYGFLFGFLLHSCSPFLYWAELKIIPLSQVLITVIPEPRPSGEHPSLLYLEMALKSQNTYVSPTQGPAHSFIKTHYIISPMYITNNTWAVAWRPWQRTQQNHFIRFCLSRKAEWPQMQN